MRFRLDNRTCSSATVYTTPLPEGWGSGNYRDKPAVSVVR